MLSQTAINNLMAEAVNKHLQEEVFEIPSKPASKKSTSKKKPSTHHEVQGGAVLVPQQVREEGKEL